MFLRAQTGDPIHIREIKTTFQENEIPDVVSVIHRQQTYLGPKLRVEADKGDEQWKLTPPGPNSEAIIWKIQDMEWIQVAEVMLEMGDDLPQQKM